MSEREVELTDNVLSNYRDGDERGWDAEFAWLRDRRADRLAELRQSVEAEGIREPILLGNDGRVWDGHHRLCVAHDLGLDTVPVERVPSLDGGLTDEERRLLPLSTLDPAWPDVIAVTEAIIAARLADAEARAEAADQAWRYAHAKASEYVELVARIHEVYRHLVMDTEEDRALHARHVETADKALALAREALRGDQ